MVKSQKTYSLQLEELQKQIANTNKLMCLLELARTSKKLSKSLTFHIYQEKLNHLIKQQNELLKKYND